MNEPDYKNYSLSELTDALNNIDKNRFPERVNIIENEISLRRKQNNNPIHEEIVQPVIDSNIDYDISSMNKWLIRISVIMQIGGGFLGIVASLTNLFQAQFSVATIILTIIAIIFFIFGIYSAILLIERKSSGLDYSIIFNFVQIPVLTSPIISFYIHAGAYFTITLGIVKFNFNYMLGSIWHISFFMRDESFSLGANLIAVIFFLLLDKAKNKLKNQVNDVVDEQKTNN